MAKTLSCLLSVGFILCVLLHDCNTTSNDGKNSDVSGTAKKSDPVVSSSNDDEIMDTADTIVFRPLFRYQKQNVQKKRVFRDGNGNISNSPAANTKPSSSSEVGHKPGPPQYLVYDKSTGSYYPLTRPGSSYTGDSHYRIHRS